MKPIFKDLQKKYDYEEHGGTSLIGSKWNLSCCSWQFRAKVYYEFNFRCSKMYKNNLIEATKSNIIKRFPK